MAIPDFQKKIVRELRAAANAIERCSKIDPDSELTVEHEIVPDYTDRTLMERVPNGWIILTTKIRWRK